MKARTIGALLTGLALTACMNSDDPGLAEQQQAEIIEVHACQPGYIEVGDGRDLVCIDPWDRGGGGGGGLGGGGGPAGPVGGEREPTGGGGGADPNPIPTPRGCTVEADHERCYACCDWNVDKVWGERCRRLPRRERRTCWEDAERRRGDCQRWCPGPIITVAP
jgi:hypothetical protein